MEKPRRLSDRIVTALELAIAQGNLPVAEHLNAALEQSLTHVGGRDVIDHRDVPEQFFALIEKLDELRRRVSDGT